MIQHNDYTCQRCKYKKKLEVHHKIKIKRCHNAVESRTHVAVQRTRHDILGPINKRTI